MAKSIENIILGVCPFCHGKVTVTLKENVYSDESTVWFQYSYDGQPECERGCHVERISRPQYTFRFTASEYFTHDAPTPEEVAGKFTRLWVEDCTILNQCEPCSKCGGKPKFSTGTNGEVRYGCSHCKRWEENEYFFSCMVNKWTKNESEANSRKRESNQLADMLNGLNQR